MQQGSSYILLSVWKKERDSSKVRVVQIGKLECKRQQDWTEGLAKIQSREYEVEKKRLVKEEPVDGRIAKGKNESDNSSTGTWLDMRAKLHIRQKNYDNIRIEFLKRYRRSLK